MPYSFTRYLPSHCMRWSNSFCMSFTRNTTIEFVNKYNANPVNFVQFFQFTAPRPSPTCSFFRPNANSASHSCLTIPKHIARSPFTGRNKSNYQIYIYIKKHTKLESYLLNCCYMWNKSSVEQFNRYSTSMKRITKKIW